MYVCVCVCDIVHIDYDLVCVNIIIFKRNLK